MSEFVLYSYFRSSASHRVRIALNLKNIAYEYRAVHLLNAGGEQHFDEYRKLNPSREVPTLVHEGKVLSQSLAIIDYIDRVRPTPRLFPEDPYERARMMQACEIVNSGVQPVVNLRVLNGLEKKFGASQDQKNEWARHWLTYGLETLEAFFKSTANDFCFGKSVSAADCFLIPHLVSCDRFKADVSAFPVLSKIRKNCEQLEAFKKAAPAVQPDTPPTT